MPDSNGLLADRYRLLDRIAVGGVGEVWRATDLVLHREVAVKLLRGEYADHPEALARFRAEARHAASLSHVAIAHVYDYGEESLPRTAYLVMELVNGPSLNVVLRDGPLGVARTLDVVAQTAAGLSAAHAAGLVHRDIKPANLLVAPGGQVKITDFGIAHAAGSAPITRTGTLVGTPAYLAPERAAGRPATGASDLYSLGVVAYQCLTGEAPFHGTPVEVALAHRDRPLPPVPATVPAPVAALVADLTAKDPAARPPSAENVARRARDLHAAMTTGSAARTGGPPPGALPDQQPAPGLPATLIGMPAAVAGAPGHAPPSAGRAPAARGLARSPRGAALAAAVIVVAILGGWLTAEAMPASSPHLAGAQPSTHPPTVPAARLADVTGGALIGQPVDVARQHLLQLGLRPKVVWIRRGDQPPGAVVSVHPTGQVPVGSTVTLVAAVPPPGHGHGGGEGNGQGQGGNGN